MTRQSTAKKLSIPTLAERVRALEEEVNDALDRLADQTRPSSVPAGVMRRMWRQRPPAISFAHILLPRRGRADEQVRPRPFTSHSG
jgi:hypothetical protein